MHASATKGDRIIDLDLDLDDDVRMLEPTLDAIKTTGLTPTSAPCTSTADTTPEP